MLAGGEGRPDGLDGYFVRPTLFANVRNDMTIAREEIFGPVLSIIPYADEEEAIAIANDTVYGLQAYVLAGTSRGRDAVAARLVAGRVLINTRPTSRWHPLVVSSSPASAANSATFGLEAFLEPKAVLGLHAA